MTAEPGDASPFPKRLTAWVSGCAAACLLGSIVLAILTKEEPAHRTGPSTTSASALGHGAFVELLRATGVEVVIARRGTARRTADASLLMLLEPLAEGGRASPADLSGMIAAARCPVLVALPKWRELGVSLGRTVVEARPGPEIQQVLSAVGASARLLPPSPTRPTVDWSPNDLGADPSIQSPQLFTAAEWSPVIGGGGGMLAGERELDGRRVAILADPDALANHGLHREENAAFVLDLVARLRSDGRPVLVDETLHGLGVGESFWAQLFRWPLALVTAQAALAAALFLSAGMRRFGAPEPAPPPYAPGKAFLIDHSASLLDAERHHGEALARYATLTAEDAARRLNAKGGGHHGDVRAWIGIAEGRKRITERFHDLEAEAASLRRRRPADPRRALGLAMRLDRWKQEMSDGPQVRTGARS